MKLLNLVNFYLERFVLDSKLFDSHELCEDAFDQVVADFRYHFSDANVEHIRSEILNNRILGMYLYRLVRTMHVKGYEESIKYQIHHIMKTICGCEIYWTANIGEGFHLDHGVGTVIGGDVHIGKGFWIYHGCRISYASRDQTQEAPLVGDDVTMYANAQILGNVTIGDRVVIKANAVVTNNVKEGTICEVTCTK